MNTESVRTKPNGHTAESVIEYPLQQKRIFFHRLTVLPFEAAIALASVWGGLASLFGLTISGQAFGTALPPNMATAFNLLYIISGLAILFGLGWGYRNLEACGLILLLTSLTVRSIALAVTFGLAPSIATMLVQAAIFAVATIIRLRTVFKNGTTVQVSGGLRVE